MPRLQTPREKELGAALTRSQAEGEDLKRKLESLKSILSQKDNKSLQEFLSDPNWVAGITSPLILFFYNTEFALSGKPPYCSSPDEILAELRKSIMGDKCHANLHADPSTGPLLTITCTLSESQGCEDLSSSFVWSERQAKSTKNFAVRAVSVARRKCDDKYYEPTDAAQKSSRQMGMALQEFLRRCEP